MAYPSIWLQKAMINIQQSANSGSVDIQASTKDIDVTLPDRDIAVENNTNGGQIVSYNPDGTYEIKLSGWVNSNASLTALYCDSTTAQSSSMSIVNTFAISRLPVRTVILWTNDTAATSAVNSTAATSNSKRLVCVKGFITSFTKKYSSSDGKLMCDITIKGPSHLTSGTGTIVSAEINGGTLAAVTAYTESDI